MGIKESFFDDARILVAGCQIPVTGNCHEF